MEHKLVQRLFVWLPSIDTGMAALSLGVITLFAYLGINVYGDTWLNPLIFSFFGTLGVCVIFPLYWSIVIKKEGLNSLGITKKRWLISFIIGVLLGAFSFFGYYRSVGISSWFFPALVVGLYAFWEVFFVYGWFQLRMEKAFGIVPSIIFAGANFSIYHMGYGWYGFPDFITFLVIGIIMGIIFRCTKNILILWPFLWPLSCLRGFASGGFFPDWKVAGTSAFMLVLMLISVYIFSRIQTMQLNRGQPLP
jgi:hypothetical protein